MAWGLEYFAMYDVFSLGVIAIVQLVIFLYLFTYLGLRGFDKEPHEKAVWITISSLLVLFLLSLFGIPSLIVGFCGVITWALAQRHFLKQKRRDFAVSFFALWAMLIIFSLIGDTMRWGLILIAIVYSYAIGEHEIRKNKKETPKEPAKEEKKK